MNFESLFHDDRAVSPVIGVILMVAITVILAAVIGTFVLGLGDQVQQTTPQASFGFDSTTVEVLDGSTGTDVTAVQITHESGNSIDASNLKVTVDGTPAWTEGSADNTVAGTFSGEVSAGSTITILAAYDPGTTNITDGDEYKYDTGADALDINDGASTPSGVASDVGLGSGDTVRIIYDSPDSDNTATLATFEVQ